MPLIDLHESGCDIFDSLITPDICIVGTGPAGSTVAAELSNSGKRILVLESGTSTRTPEADALDEIVNVGRSRNPNQWSVRNRILGGSSYTWGGRCAPLDEIDFATRSWIPESGWPITTAELTPYLDRSADHLGLTRGTEFSGDPFWNMAGIQPPNEPLDRDRLLPFFWQFSRDRDESYRFEYMRFGRHLLERVGPNVTVITGATALRVLTEPSGHAVVGVELAAPDGLRRTVSSPIVVLCTGGIETPRILLASNDVVDAGLGNDRDLVGRYLMDHLRGDLGNFKLAGTEILQKRLGRYNVRNRLFRAGFRLSPELQEAEGLLNCAAWLGEEVSPEDPWEALMRLILRTGNIRADVGRLISGRDLLSQGIIDYFVRRNGVPRRFEALKLVGMCEQRPDPESRVVLAEKTDRFGMRLPEVNWRSHPDEARTLIRMAKEVCTQLNRCGYPSPILADWVRDDGPVPDSFVDVAHPTGTARMADSPDRGVVDSNCQVYGVRGLYIAGSAVFPTGGHCNPTQTIVALSIRLADHLRRETPVFVSRPQAEDPAEVLVTGATGRIGSVVVPRLLAEGFRVRVVSRRGVDTEMRHSRLDDRLIDLGCATPADYRELVVGCRHVVHLAAELGDVARMDDTNIGATRALAEAAEDSGMRSVCYVSSVSVYGSALEEVVDEDAPVLTTDRDVRGEYWAIDYVRKYGRTKLAGEHALRSVAKRVRYTVLRPTVVVDIDQVASLRSWSWIRRSLMAHRRTHHIYVEDVAEAIVWSLHRAETEGPSPGTIDIFNLSDDAGERETYADVFRFAYQQTKDPRYRSFEAPAVIDWLRDFTRFRTSPLRRPLWRMRFPAQKIHETGFSPRFGVRYAQIRSVATVGTEPSYENNSNEGAPKLTLR